MRTFNIHCAGKSLLIAQMTVSGKGSQPQKALHFEDLQAIWSSTVSVFSPARLVATRV